jgi:3-methyl-2-oxobutanoate hydroxymethyltransferase
LLDHAPPRHAKPYAQIGQAVEIAIRAYVDEVRNGAFPTAAQSAGMDPGELAQALAGMDGSPR